MLYLKNKEAHEEAQAVLDRYEEELTDAYHTMLENQKAETYAAYRAAVAAYWAIDELLEALELGGDRDDEEDYTDEL